MALPPTSPCMSSCGAETHLMFSGHSTIDASSSDTSARAAPGARVGQPAPKGRIESEPRGPSQLRGVRGVSTHRTAPIANRHDSPWFESFRSHFALFWSFWLAISEPGWISRGKKPHLESGLNKRDRATGGFSGVYTHRKPGKKIYCRGFCGRFNFARKKREKNNGVFPPPVFFGVFCAFWGCFVLFGVFFFRCFFSALG